MTNYEVIRSRQWVNIFDGRRVSIYGANPPGKPDEWQIRETGWTVKNPFTGQVGIGRKPWETFQAACEWALANKPTKSAIGD